MAAEAGRRTRAAIERVRALARERRAGRAQVSRRAFVVDQARGRRLAAARQAAERLGSNER